MLGHLYYVHVVYCKKKNSHLNMLRVDLDTDREQVWHRHHDLTGGMHAEESLGLSWCFSRVPLIVFVTLGKDTYIRVPVMGSWVVGPESVSVTGYPGKSRLPRSAKLFDASQRFPCFPSSAVSIHHPLKQTRGTPSTLPVSGLQRESLFHGTRRETKKVGGGC